MRNIVSSTRYIVLLGVIASLLLSAGVFLLGMIQTILMIKDAVFILGEEEVAKEFAIAAITMADFFLIAVGLYIVAIGLYELFIGRLDLPKWLLTKSIEDLKEKLINVIVVVLAVTFLSEVTNWDGTSNLLPYGASISLLILALTAFTFFKRDNKEREVVYSDTFNTIDLKKSSKMSNDKEFIGEPHG